MILLSCNLPSFTKSIPMPACTALPSGYCGVGAYLENSLSNQIHSRRMINPMQKVGLSIRKTRRSRSYAGPSSFAWVLLPMKSIAKTTSCCTIAASRFAIATTPVTAEQYQKFLDSNPGGTLIRWTEYSPDDDCPITGANWYHSAEYCNWLSKVEGLEPVYVPNSDGFFGPGMSFHKKCLNRSGYRLPTRAEWEYAARAGAGTAWSFGDSGELLPNYAWFAGNSHERSWPVGSLKPNNLGLFDAHGNVLEWLHRTQDVLVTECGKIGRLRLVAHPR